MDATHIRKGSFIMHKGDLWVVIETTHRTPGNKRGFVQMKIKNMANGTHIVEKFSSNEDVETAWLDTRMSQYLYDDANTGPVFMDVETYEQFGLDRGILGDAMNYVKENDEVEVTFHDGAAIGLRLPAKVDLIITETDPAVKGDTVNSVMKDAVLETGFTVKVPGHIRLGDKIRISTTNGEFHERVNS